MRVGTPSRDPQWASIVTSLFKKMIGDISVQHTLENISDNTF